MRIAIDARMIKPGTMHGIARYVFQLLECFKQVNSQHEFYMIINRDNPLEQKQWPANMKFIRTKARWISFSEQWELSYLLRKHQIDLFHAPSFVAPILCPTKMIMTIHDLNHLVLPQFYTPLHLFYYQTFVKSCIKRSRFLLTVSNFSKDEIVKNLDVSPEKIFVTYNGVSANYMPVVDPARIQYVRDIYELPEKFIFCLSNNKPHKNVHQLVRAFCFSQVDMPLVLATTADPSLIRLAEYYGKKHLIYFSKFIEEEHLPAVYSMTQLFVYPSTYEGFGLPPLEALSCGAPVVVARSASLPEVVGPHATFMNPYDYQNIALALERAVHSPSLKADMQSERIAYARSFSWEHMATKTLDVYERCFND